MTKVDTTHRSKGTPTHLRVLDIRFGPKVVAIGIDHRLKPTRKGGLYQKASSNDHLSLLNDSNGNLLMLAELGDGFVYLCGKEIVPSLSAQHTGERENNTTPDQDSHYIFPCRTCQTAGLTSLAARTPDWAAPSMTKSVDVCSPAK